MLRQGWTLTKALILSNAAGYEDQTISLGSGSAVFTNIAGDIQAGGGGGGLLLPRLAALEIPAPVRLPSRCLKRAVLPDLAKLGFTTTLDVPETLGEDLIVFTTGSLGNTAALSASYEDGEADPLQLRASPLQINFTSDSTYQITDTQARQF